MLSREEAHKLVDALFDASEHAPDVNPDTVGEQPKRELPEGKRVVRTKSSGDRVFMLDEEKKTRQWVTNPEVLGKLGFELTDVTDVEEDEFQKYQMASAIYRLDNEKI